MKELSSLTTQERFERELLFERRFRIFYISGMLVIVAILTFIGSPLQIGNAHSAETTKAAGDDSGKILRARGLIIEDEQGRSRIVIGSPVPDPKEGKRMNQSTGIVINDAEGYERFGLNLDEKGRMGMGFDAPPGKGDPRNRERINIMADEDGSSYIRFLNRKTQAVSFFRLDNEDRFYHEFLDWQPKKIVSRQISFDGEKVIKHQRK